MYMQRKTRQHVTGLMNYHSWIWSCLCLPVYLLVESTTGVTVTLTGSADYAVLRQTFRFTCTVTDEDDPTLGSVLFKKEGSASACVVIPSSCSQNGISPRYSCGCVSGQRDVYFMNISSVSEQEDEGTWLCQRRSDYSNNITLPVYYGPFSNVTLDKSSPQRVTESSSLTVVCSSTCKPCSYTWRRGTVTVSSTKTLSLTNINRNQAGDYICTATNTQIGTTATSTLTVDVQYKPVISGQDSSYPVVESSPLHINCSSYTTPGNPSTTSYGWTGPDSYTSTGPILSISSIIRTQTGQYTCTASNTLTPTGGPSQIGTATGEFMVDVQYLQITSFTLNSNENLVTVSESDHVTMRCQVDSNPGSTIRLLNESDELSRADNSLIEFNWTAACRQRGNYSCTATNNIDDIGMISKSIHLAVKCSTRLDVPPKQKITAAVGDDATLSVTLLSYPEPSITWRKTNNTTLRNLTSISSVSRVSDISVTASLTLTGVQQQDFGEYFVQADNGVGTAAVFSVRLSVATEESTPLNTGGSNSAGLIGGAVVGVVIVLVTVIAVVVVFRRRRNRGDDKEHITNTTTIAGNRQVSIETGSTGMAVYAEVKKKKKPTASIETGSTGMAVYAEVKKKKKPTAKASGHHSNKAYQHDNQRTTNTGEKSPNVNALNYLEVEIVQNDSNPSKSVVRLQEEKTVYTTIKPGVRGPQMIDDEDYK